MIAARLPPGRRVAIAAFTVAFVFALAAPVAANHVQNENGRTVVFDHKTGNEWWVEVILSGQDGGIASAVEARDTSGPWVALTKRSWGAWAASFQIEPGHMVQFRASWAGGSQVMSCWFTHPAGVEECAAAFDATFTLVKGNEWWVQTQVTPNSGHTVSAVDVRLNKGDWRPLKLQSWGVREWAASYHIPDGTIVQLRATSAGGATDLSSCYRWIPPQTGGQDAAPTACPADRFDATFKNARGNNWWVEVDVTGNEPLTAVEARVGCEDPWRPLTLRSWGSWAASFFVETGSHVDFRARSTLGSVDGSDVYIWPEASKQAPCGSWPRDGSFAHWRFRGHQVWTDDEGAHDVSTDGLASITTDEGGVWTGTCEVRRETVLNGESSVVVEKKSFPDGPVRGRVPTSPGSLAWAQTIENCMHIFYRDVHVIEGKTRTFSLRTSSGDPIPINAWHAQESSERLQWDFWWDTRHGLVLSWNLHHHSENNDASFDADGWLLDSDAPWS